MRTVTLFIAMSLDGFVADKSGGIGWLGGENPAGEDMAAYNEFIQDIDTVVMGWNTYQQITGALMSEAWPYEGMTTYVLTHRELPDKAEICFVHGDSGALIRQLKAQSGRGIWICGGAELAQQLLREDLIDVLHINLIPTILGGGIRLFGPLAQERPLRLLKTQSYNGISDVVYTCRTSIGPAE